MSEASFPGPGPDGEQPPPGDPARDETAGAPAGVPEDDWDGDAEMAAYIADLDAGRARIPEEWEVEGPAATIGLGDAADVDLAELAAMLGPDGLGGEVFAQDRSADAMRPGPVLSALTEQAAGDLGRLTDNQVIGAMSAARRLAARAAYLELTAVAEFTRRREAQLGGRHGAQGAARLPGRRVPRRRARHGAGHLARTRPATPMDLATDLETRLPRTWAALGAGLIDEYRARLIWRPTRCLSDADAATPMSCWPALAPGLRYDQLARKATALAMKLDPEAFKRGKEQGPSATGSGWWPGGRSPATRYLSGRELAIEDALASEGAHRRAGGRAAPRRAARHPAAPASAGLQRPDPGPRARWTGSPARRRTGHGPGRRAVYRRGASQATTAAQRRLPVTRSTAATTARTPRDRR